MSMITGFISCGNNSVRRIEIKNADGTRAGAITITKSAKKKKKRLQYNFKYISMQIMQASTSVIARQAAATAGQNVASLRKRLGSGDYDERELQSAILHAEAMVRVAKKRIKHLQEEEIAGARDNEYSYDYEGVKAEKSGERVREGQQAQESSEQDIEAMRELLREYRKIMQETMQDLMRDAMEEAAGGNIEELSEELMVSVKKDMSPSDLEMLKKKHRSEELREIMEADMKYLKALFYRLSKEKQDTGNGTDAGGVALELGGVEIPLQTMEMPVITEGGNVDSAV